MFIFVFDYASVFKFVNDSIKLPRTHFMSIVFSSRWRYFCLFILASFNHTKKQLCVACL